jgi:hypothetical protein
MFKFVAAALGHRPLGMAGGDSVRGSATSVAHRSALIGVSHAFPADKDPLSMFAERLRRPVAPADPILAVRRLMGDCP